MLSLTIQAGEYWDSSIEEFYDLEKDVVLQLEHSLVSVSKWESKYKTSFLSHKEFTKEELMYYVKCMTITQNVSQNVYRAISAQDINMIKEYINDSMTATTFSSHKDQSQFNAGHQKQPVITSELIYYWMFSLQIPKECEKWHLMRLLTLIRVFDEKQKEQERKSKAGKTKTPASHHAAMNAARRGH